MFEELEIKRIDLKEGVQSLKDKIVREVPFTLKINGEEVATLLCSPDKLKELAAGYLFVEGLGSSNHELKDILVDERALVADIKLEKKPAEDQLEKKRVITSGCGRNISFYNFEDFKNNPPVKSDLKIKAEVILGLMKEFQKKSETFKETGGVHSAALCGGGKIISFAEDIGRHNAVDKIIGDALLKGIEIKDKFLLLSGRISSEMLTKASRIGLPVICSRSAPTDMAVRLAKQLNITLAGFARGSRMNVYSTQERISVPE